jgi:hypothetical protein
VSSLSGPGPATASLSPCGGDAAAGAASALRGRAAPGSWRPRNGPSLSLSSDSYRAQSTSNGSSAIAGPTRLFLCLLTAWWLGMVLVFVLGLVGVLEAAREARVGPGSRQSAHQRFWPACEPLQAGCSSASCPQATKTHTPSQLLRSSQVLVHGLSPQPGHFGDRARRTHFTRVCH